MRLRKARVENLVEFQYENCKVIFSQSIISRHKEKCDAVAKRPACGQGVTKLRGKILNIRTYLY